MLDTYTSPARTFVIVTHCLPLGLNHYVSYVTGKIICILKGHRWFIHHGQLHPTWSSF